MPSGTLFRREWFQLVDDWPREIIGVVRAWDDAASRNGDWTVGVLMVLILVICFDPRPVPPRQRPVG